MDAPLLHAKAAFHGQVLTSPLAPFTLSAMKVLITFIYMAAVARTVSGLPVLTRIEPLILVAFCPLRLKCKKVVSLQTEI